MGVAIGMIALGEGEIADAKVPRAHGIDVNPQAAEQGESVVQRYRLSLSPF